VLATTNIRNLDTEIELGPQDGMPRSYVLNADQTDAAEKVFLTKRITTLGAEKISAVCRTLARATGC
jgi:mRNA-degrading endonuclease toxin of MazEF toxin-antitoxin module